MARIQNANPDPAGEEMIQYVNMQQYVKNYHEALGIFPGDYIGCEIPECGKPAADIHHIVPRSLGGSDDPENLIALCRDNHDDAANGKITKEELFAVVAKRG